MSFELAGKLSSGVPLKTRIVNFFVWVSVAVDVVYVLVVNLNLMSIKSFLSFDALFKWALLCCIVFFTYQILREQKEVTNSIKLRWISLYKAAVIFSGIPIWLALLSSLYYATFLVFVYSFFFMLFTFPIGGILAVIFALIIRRTGN